MKRALQALFLCRLIGLVGHDSPMEKEKRELFL